MLFLTYILDLGFDLPNQDAMVDQDADSQFLDEDLLKYVDDSKLFGVTNSVDDIISFQTPWVTYTSGQTPTLWSGMRPSSHY